ncbi:hypothetical protein HK100_007311, partial [Physocladia obscura]
MDETTTPPQTTTSSYDPHSNRGRKQQVGDSENKRTQQMRAAQRALRARKQQYMHNLETKNKELVSEIADLKQQIKHVTSNANNGPCFNVNCVAQIQALQIQVFQMQTTLDTVARATFSNAAAVATAAAGTTINKNNGNTFEDVLFGTPGTLNYLDDNSLSLDWIWASATGQQRSAPGSPVQNAEEAVGPIQIEPFKSEVKNLTSLKTQKVVDRLFDVALRQSKTTDAPLARYLLIRMLRENLRIQSRVSAAEKRQLLEIIAKFYFKNMRQFEHYRQLCILSNAPATKGSNYTTVTDRATESAETAALRKTLRAIPSLANAEDYEIEDFLRAWESKSHNDSEFDVN